MSLIQSLISSDKYGVKCPYLMTPKGICVHNTANDASARNEITYMKSNNNEVSFHIVIDDIESIQAIPFNRNAWAAGDGGSGNGNRNYIHIEICYSKSGGSKFAKAEERAAEEIAALLKVYGWTISNVKKHQDFSGKYCPHRTLDIGWQRFLNMISSKLSASPSNSTSSSSKIYRVRKSATDSSSQIGAFQNLDSAKKVADANAGYKVFDESGKQAYPNISDSSYKVEITTDVLNVRKGAGTNYPIVTTVKNNEIYTIVETSGNWGKLKSGAGWICLDYASKC